MSECMFNLPLIFRLAMTAIAVLFRVWKRMLQFTCALHIITPLLMNFIPESPRWLLAGENVNRRQEARGILKDAAKLNQKLTNDIDEKIDAAILNDDNIRNNKAKERFIYIFKYYFCHLPKIKSVILFTFYVKWGVDIKNLSHHTCDYQSLK